MFARDQMYNGEMLNSKSELDTDSKVRVYSLLRRESSFALLCDPNEICSATQQHR